jgi:hypothetical protein
LHPAAAVRPERQDAQPQVASPLAERLGLPFEDVLDPALERIGDGDLSYVQGTIFIGIGF